MEEASIESRLLADALVQKSGSNGPGKSSLIFEVLAVFYIAFIGLFVAAMTVEVPVAHPNWAATAGIASVATILAFVFARASRVNGAEIVHTNVRRAVNEAAAVASAFIVIVACAALAGAGPRYLAFLITWLMLAASVAALLQLRRREPKLVLVGAPQSTAEVSSRIAALKPDRRKSGIDLFNAASPEDLTRLDRLAYAGAIDLVIIPSSSDEAQIETICTRLADSGLRVCLELSQSRAWRSPFAAAFERADKVFPLLDLLPSPFIGRRRIAKRVFDLVVVAALMPILIILFPMVALAISVESKGPVLFRQWRFGQGSKPVQIFKFRTMRMDLCDVTGADRTLPTDPRVTRVGRVLRRLSIDEIPQLINVLRGEMSLVGPRAHPTHMMVEGRYYFEAVEAYQARHRMLPGITGWAQVNGSRGEVDTVEKARRRLELDLYYIANWSPLLDLWIVIRTAFGGFLNLRAD